MSHAKDGSRRGKPSNTEKSSVPSGPTKAERIKQSKGDKAKHQALLAAAALAVAPRQQGRRSQNRKRRARTVGGPNPVAQGRVKRFLQSLRRGMPCAVPTRVEVLHFRARYSLTIGERHMVMFHPANSISLGMLTSYMTEPRDLTSYPRGMHDDLPTKWEPSTILGNQIAECEGVPNNLVSTIGRVTGGVMSIKITGCDGATGYAVSSCPMRDEIVDHKSIYDKHATSIRLKRHELGSGTRDFAFHAPVVSPAAMETFTGLNTQYHWSEGDPFGGIVVTFHNLQYNATYGMPFVVELDMQIGIQSRLTLDDRHLATTHLTEKGDVKVDLHSDRSMGHIGSGSGAASQAIQASASEPAGSTGTR